LRFIIFDPTPIFPRKGFDFALIFSREIRPEKNRENFDILQSHNKLSARYLRAFIRFLAGFSGIEYH